MKTLPEAPSQVHFATQYNKIHGQPSNVLPLLPPLAMRPLYPTRPRLPWAV